MILPQGPPAISRRLPSLPGKWLPASVCPDNIGVVCYDDDDDEVFIGRDLAHAKSHSELISGEIDKRG